MWSLFSQHQRQRRADSHPLCPSGPAPRAQRRWLPVPPAPQPEAGMSGPRRLRRSCGIRHQFPCPHQRIKHPLPASEGCSVTLCAVSPGASERERVASGLSNGCHLVHEPAPPRGASRAVGHLVRCSPAAGCCGTAARTRPLREEGRLPAASWPRDPGSARLAFPGSRCSAGGGNGRRALPGQLQPRSTRWAQAAACTSLP